MLAKSLLRRSWYRERRWPQMWRWGPLCRVCRASVLAAPLDAPGPGAQPFCLSPCGMRLQRVSVCPLVAWVWVGGLGHSLDLRRAQATWAPALSARAGARTGRGTDSCWGAGPGRGCGQQVPLRGPGLALLGPLRWGRGRQTGRWPGGGSGQRSSGCRLGPNVAPASFQGWSSFATGASKFASAAKEGVSSLPRRATRPMGPSPAGQPGLWEMGRVWWRGASPHAQACARLPQGAHPARVPKAAVDPEGHMSSAPIWYGPCPRVTEMLAEAWVALEQCGVGEGECAQIRPSPCSADRPPRLREAAASLQPPPPRSALPLGLSSVIGRQSRPAARGGGGGVARTGRGGRGCARGPGSDPGLSPGKEQARGRPGQGGRPAAGAVGGSRATPVPVPAASGDGPRTAPSEPRETRPGGQDVWSVSPVRSAFRRPSSDPRQVRR